MTPLQQAAIEALSALRDLNSGWPFGELNRPVEDIVDDLEGALRAEGVISDGNDVDEDEVDEDKEGLFEP